MAGRRHTSKRHDVTLAAINYAPERTGIGPYVASLARGLARAGLDVSVETTPPHYPEWHIHEGYGQWTRRGVEDGVCVTRRRHHIPVGQSSLERLVSEVSFGLRLLAARLRCEVLVLVSPALFSSLVLLPLMRVRGVHTVAWVQDLYATGAAETGRGGLVMTRLLTWAERFFLRSVDDVVVIHDRFKEIVVDLGVAPDAVHVIPNWSHVETHHNGADPVSEREEFGWSRDDVVVLHAGNQGVKQGLHNVVEAARLADSSAAPVRFVLLGDGKDRDELQRASIGVASIDFIDPLDDVAFARALAGADVLLLNERPGIREMCVPSKLTTYFATGKPVLAATTADSLAAREVHKSGGGVVVPAGDPQAMLDEALSLASDSERSRRLGQAGLAYRSRVLSTEAAIAAWRVVLKH